MKSAATLAAIALNEARKKKLSPARRREIGQMGAAARWRNHKKNADITNTNDEDDASK